MRVCVYVCMRVCVYIGISVNWYEGADVRASAPLYMRRYVECLSYMCRLRCKM